MTGPVYYTIWLFCGTLYPAYESFKAVKTKNTKNYVRWMMYWIVYAIFAAVESILDPILYFWLPFYSESKILLFLYMVSSSTRGSTSIYRHLVHPQLCSREAEIDVAIDKFKSKTYQTIKQWVTDGFQKLGGIVTQTAINGGGGLVQSFRRSYSMMDLSETNTRNNMQMRMYRENIIEEDEDADNVIYNSANNLKHYKSEEYLNHNNPNYASLKRLRSPDFVKSNESLSSGYSTDSFLPSGYELHQEERFGDVADNDNVEWEQKLDNIVRAMKSSKSRIEGNKATKSHRNIAFKEQVA